MKKIYIVPAVLALILGLNQTLPVYANTDNSGKDKDKKEVRIENDLKSRMPGLEVQIGANGKTLVRGAKVTAISGNTITATTGWGSSVLVWNVTTDSETKFIELSSGNSLLANVKVGDTLSFQGSIVTTVATPLTVNAKVVKNWSRGPIQKTTLEGKAKTTVGTTTLPTSFTLSAGGTEYQVRISSLTSVLNAVWLRIPLGSIKAGDTVRVYGAVNTDSTVDATVVRDVSVR